MSGMGNSTRKFPSWITLVLWILLCILGVHFLADNSQHVCNALDVESLASQGSSETFDEHLLETNFILPEDGTLSSPLALVVHTYQDRAFTPQRFIIYFLTTPRN